LVYKFDLGEVGSSFTGSSGSSHSFFGSWFFCTTPQP
jgi:hypothetical protein